MLISFFWMGGGGISAVEFIFKTCKSKGALDEFSHQLVKEFQ